MLYQYIKKNQKETQEEAEKTKINQKAKELQKKLEELSN